MGALVLAMLFWRGDVVRLLPQTAAFYKLVGLDVNLRGLSFKDLKITKRLHANYDTKLDVPTPAGTLTSKRGWAAVDVKFKGKRLRFVDTHLEAFGDTIREAQARELVAAGGPLRGKRQLIYAYRVTDRDGGS